MNYDTDYSKCDTVIHDSVTDNPYLGTEFIMILTILSIFTKMAVILNLLVMILTTLTMILTILTLLLLFL